MAPPRKDPGAVGRALADHGRGMSLAAAAKKHGVSASTLDRARAAKASKAKAAGAGALVQVQVGAPASPAPAPIGSGVVLELLAEVDALLASLPDAPEARVLGAALRVVATELKQGVDASKIPGIVNALRTATLAVREMRGPLPPSPDALAETLRQLDGPARRKIEAYTEACDVALGRRMAALRAWLTERLRPVELPELSAMLDGLHAPPEIVA